VRRRQGNKEKRGDGETASNVIPDESACGGRDPWFDRPFDRLTVLSKVEGLTTLSEVEGVSSKVLFFLDSPPQADLRRIPE
jgi:hypothetical protein